MIIRFLRDYRRYKKGDVFEQWPGGAATVLIKKHIMEEVVVKQKTRTRPRRENGNTILQP